MHIFLIVFTLILQWVGILAEADINTKLLVSENLEEALGNAVEQNDCQENLFEKLLIDVIKINIPGYPNALNPSLLKNKKGFLLVFRHCPGPTSFESYIGVVQLDKYFNPISKAETLTNRPPGSDIISRLQDARIFTYQGRQFVLYNDNLDPVYPNPNGRKDMYLSQLVFENAHYRLLPPLKLVYHDKYYTQKVQKNWVPFIWNDQLLFAFYINPHEILIPNLSNGDCSLLSYTSFPCNWEWGELRGGTPAVLVDGEYLAFFHSSISVENAKHYYIGAYTFSAEPPFNITKISPKPIKDPRFYTAPSGQQRFIFPGGLVVSGNQVYIAYGKDDKEVWIAKINKKRLMQTLIKVKK